MATEERNARAMQEVAAYRKRVAEETAESREEFLAQHEDLRDLLEPILEETRAVTASVPPAQKAPSLPDALQQEVLAVHAGPTEVRAGKVEELCRRHPEDATEIRSFIESLERAEDRVIAAVQKTSPAPEQIGPYRILSVLGEGGMGTVYIAEQRKPVRRRVALKVIKLGMDSKQVLVRFEAERQALAMMEHTNIARVYEAGTTELGQPFFAMEYVKGQ